MKSDHPIVLGKHVIFFIYTLLFILAALFVFKANDGSQPIKEVLMWNYLIPVIIYGTGTIRVLFYFFSP